MDDRYTHVRPDAPLTYLLWRRGRYPSVARPYPHPPRVTPRSRIRLVWGMLSCALLAATLSAQDGHRVRDARTMSFGDRLLFNRMAVTAMDAFEVMLAAELGEVPRVSALVERLGGRVRYTDAEIGYVRAEIGRSRFAELVSDSRIVAYGISSLSQGAWYDDGPTEARETMFRNYEVFGLDPANNTDTNREPPSDLKAISIEESRQPGYTASDDVGLDAWFASHPTYDGRGITMAVMEGATPDFGHPVFGSAKTLDGRDVPKFAGIHNTGLADAPDAARVDMTRVIHPTSAWHRVDERTYIVPRPGTFRFGVFSIPLGENLSRAYAILWDEASGDVWVDTNGDASFRDERPMRDVNERFESRQLTVPPIKIEFVVTVAPRVPAVYVYVGTYQHLTMTAGLSAGSRSSDSLALGVAPGARLLLIHQPRGAPNAHDFVESYLEASKRPDVDVLYDSSGIESLPDASANLRGIIMSRIVAIRGKPILNSAGNNPPSLSTVNSLGDDVFSVGGTIGPATFAAFFGGAELPRITNATISGGGPNMDGTLKPDFLTPMYVIAAEVRALARRTQRGLPQNAPTRWRPHGYQVGCCTSASSPYAAGAIALLLSAAKQEGVRYSAYSLANALRYGATFLPGVPANQQGNGVINLAGAWDYLKRSREVVRIRARAPVRHALSDYLPHPGEGLGLFEREGWTRGQRGTRTVRLVRENGADTSIRYALSWTGSDGIFSAPSSVDLPRGREVEVPIAIDVRESGIHSALLNLHDPATNAIVSRVAATIVAGEPLGPDGRITTQFRGVVPLMGVREHMVTVPAGTGALRLDFTVGEGFVRPVFYPPDVRMPERYPHLMGATRVLFARGQYTYVFPNPTAGTWSLGFINNADGPRSGLPRVWAGGGEYTLSAMVLSGSIAAEYDAQNRIQYRVASTGAPLSTPALDVSSGRIETRSEPYKPTGEPMLQEVNVPADAGALIVKAKASPGSSPLEIHLYRCVTGQCFAYDQTLPAQAEQTIRVMRPEAGRWVVAINAAPALVGKGGFTLETLLTGRSQRYSLQASAEQKWTGTVARPAASRATHGGADAVLLELVDASLEEAERHTFVNPSDPRKLQNRPVAIATAVVTSQPRPASSHP